MRFEHTQVAAGSVPNGLTSGRVMVRASRADGPVGRAAYHPMGTANSNDETGRSFIRVSARQKQARKELWQLCVVAAEPNVRLGSVHRNLAHAAKGCIGSWHCNR